MTEFSSNKIVVPIDFSVQSFKALDTAMAISRNPSNVYLLHVVPRLLPGEPGVIWGEDQIATYARDAKAALRKKLSDAKYADVHSELDFGDPGYRITDYAKKIEADLIVMPSHGRTGLKRLLIGSVAERVVRMANCPVLVLRQ